MRRLLITLFVIMAIGSLAQAQTTVNLSVTDTPDNQTWNNGTWSVQLTPGPGNLDQTRNFTLLVAGGSLGSQSGSLSSTGTASMSLPANVNIGPVGTKWQFTVCSQQGTACSISNVTVVTSSPQAVALTPPSIRVASIPNLPPILVYTTIEISSASIGSQITLVGTTPSAPTLQICTVVSGNACTTWAGVGSPTAFTKTIYASDTQYAGGVKADGRYIFDATWNLNSGAVTCTNNDCNFTAADNGKACEGIAANGLNTLPVGTFTFTSAQAGSCSVIATASAAANGTFAVCTDDTAAWQAVTTALYASATPAAVVGPNGASCVTKSALLDRRASPIPWQPVFFSEGMNQFIPLATFDFTTCNGSSLAGGCFWDVNMAGAPQAIIPQYSQVVNMAVNGLGFNGCGAPASGKSAVVEHRVQGSGIWIWNWCGGVSGFTAHNFISPNALTNLQVNSAGAIGFAVSGGSSNAMTYLTNSYCGQFIASSSCVSISGGALFVSKGDFWLGCTNACIILQTGSFMTSDGDQFFGTSGTQYVDDQGTFYAFGNTQMVTTSTPNGLILTRSGGKAFVRDSVVQNTGGGGIAFNINTVTGGSIINQGGVSITGIDQTALVAANVVLSAGWGTTASVGSLSGTPFSNPTRFQFTATSAGTGQAANPTMAITYPGTGGTFTQPYWTCKQTGGTGTNTSITGEGTATTTSMTLTFNGTPVAASTYQITCQGSLL